MAAAREVKCRLGMSPSVPRVLLMCLALAFASVWLGCGPDPADDEPEHELSGLDLLPIEEGTDCGEDVE